SFLALILLAKVQPAEAATKKPRIAVAPIRDQENFILLAPLIRIRPGVPSQAGLRFKGTAGRKIVRVLLRQIVDLQTDRIRAGPLDGVNHFYDVAIVQSPWRLDEYSLLNALIFRQIRRAFHSVFVSMLFLALLKCL